MAGEESRRVGRPHITVYLDPDLKHRIEAQAKREHRSASAWFVTVAERYLEQQKESK